MRSKTLEAIPSAIRVVRRHIRVTRGTPRTATQQPVGGAAADFARALLHRYANRPLPARSPEMLLARHRAGVTVRQFYQHTAVHGAPRLALTNLTWRRPAQGAAGQAPVQPSTRVARAAGQAPVRPTT